MNIKESEFYKGAADNVVCTLCAHSCRVRRGRRGKCGVRENRGGRLFSLVYGELVAEHVDPVEKKPLFHILPGSTSLSISTMGCNFTCRHCQNNSISQVAGLSQDELRGRPASAEDVVGSAVRNGCASISYTYVEPTVFFEFAYDCSRAAAGRGIKNIFVSNGYLSEKATRTISRYLDAINIDIKSFSDRFYDEICGARLKPVLDTVVLMKELGVWVEITTLVIPGLNDSDGELQQIAEFIASVDRSIPWHVTAFYPTYRMTDRHPTPHSSLERARRLGQKAGLQFVYEGNMPGAGGENTHCPDCGQTVIRRRGFSIVENTLDGGACPGCGMRLPGVWA